MKSPKKKDAAGRFWTNALVGSKNAMVLCHWDEFVRYVATTEDMEEAFNHAVRENLEHIDQQAKEKNASVLPENRRLIKDNKIFVLARRGKGFELPMPIDPATFHSELFK